MTGIWKSVLTLSYVTVSVCTDCATYIAASYPSPIAPPTSSATNAREQSKHAAKSLSKDTKPLKQLLEDLSSECEDGTTIPNRLRNTLDGFTMKGVTRLKRANEQLANAIHVYGRHIAHEQIVESEAGTETNFPLTKRPRGSNSPGLGPSVELNPPPASRSGHLAPKNSKFGPPSRFGCAEFQLMF